jgi:serine/threonine protein kinase
MNDNFGTRELKDFQIGSKIGNGTYGTVYYATEIKTGNKVALKKMNFEVKNIINIMTHSLYN